MRKESSSDIHIVIREFCARKSIFHQLHYMNKTISTKMAKQDNAAMRPNRLH